MKCLEVNFRQCTYCLQNSGITCIAYSFSPLHEMPDIFRYFMKCLTSRIACNIYRHTRASTHTDTHTHIHTHARAHTHNTHTHTHTRTYARTYTHTHTHTHTQTHTHTHTHTRKRTLNTVPDKPHGSCGR